VRIPKRTKRQRLIAHYHSWSPRSGRLRWSGKRWAGYVLHHLEVRGFQPPQVVRESVVAASKRHLRSVKEQEDRMAKERRALLPEFVDPADAHVCPRCGRFTFDAKLNGAVVPLDAEARCLLVDPGPKAGFTYAFALHEDVCVPRKEAAGGAR
jgi:hypothetical protein